MGCCGPGEPGLLVLVPWGAFGKVLIFLILGSRAPFTKGWLAGGGGVETCPLDARVPGGGVGTAGGPRLLLAWPGLDLAERTDLESVHWGGDDP